MTRRMLTVVGAGLLAMALGVIGATLPVPYVALGPGPTYDTLGMYEDSEIVAIEGLTEYPTSGHLNMTTVSVTDRLSLFTSLYYWASGERRVIPREPIFPSGEAPEVTEQRNAEQFAMSELNAEAAALNALSLPIEVVVGEVVPDTPAAEIFEVGDELIVVYGQPVQSIDGVSAALRDTVPGQSVQITYGRDGDMRDVDVVLAASPGRPQGLLGVIPAGRTGAGSITFNLGGIGGPSAGLMFALSLYDKLTPGELTGGLFIAGTGAITAGGEVMQIDGIPFKMSAARAAGATVFMVPAGNCEEAVATAPDGLQLVRVENLQDALTALDEMRGGAAPTPC